MNELRARTLTPTELGIELQYHSDPVVAMLAKILLESEDRNEELKAQISRLESRIAILKILP